MLTLLLILAISTAAGYLLRNVEFLQKNISRTTTATVVIMLFIFGVSIGSNESIMSNLHRAGIKAAVISIFAVAGSALATTAFFYFQKKGGGK